MSENIAGTVELTAGGVTLTPIDPKPGFKTTEFWIPIVTLLLGAALILAGHSQVGTGLLFGGGNLATSYQKGRIDLKSRGF